LAHGYGEPVTTRAEVLRLRRCALAVSVLDDIDLEPADDGVLLPGPSPVLVSWREVSEVLGPHEETGIVARHRVGAAFTLRRRLAELGTAAAQALADAARPLALPRDHGLHPGPAWVQGRVLGGVLELGTAVCGLDGEDGPAIGLPPSVARAVGADPAVWWPQLRGHAERMGALAAQRLRRDGGAGVLRPVGGCDVLTLLASRSLRSALADGQGCGLRAVAVPARSRGWFDLARIDPAYVQAAWLLTSEPDRGLPRPVLVTRDEVCLPAGRR
jgi:hypothetical protein